MRTACPGSTADTAIQSNDPRITLVSGGYPLFAGGKIAGGIGVGGGTEAQDCGIAEYIVSVFERLSSINQ